MSLYSKVLASVLLAMHLFADPIVWNTAQITVPPSFQGVQQDVIVSPGPTDGTAVAVWADATTSHIPYYSIYSNGTWTTGTIPLGASAGVLNNVYVAPGPAPGQLMATWADRGSHDPFFSIYNGTSWTTGAIPAGLSTGVNRNVVVAPGPESWNMTAVWSNAVTNEVYYSFYNGTAWILTATIDTTHPARFDVFLSPGVTPNTLVATWTNGDNLHPFYATSTGSLSWNPAAEIATSPLVGGNVIPTIDLKTGQVVAVWKDTLSNAVAYSFFDGATWTMPAEIDLGTSTGCNFDAYVTSEVTGELVVTWSDRTMPGIPYFSIFQNSAWSAGAPIPLSPSASIGTLQDVSVSRLAGTDIMIAAWGDPDGGTTPPFLPYYSTFAGTPIPPPPVTAPLPPTNGQGSHVKNRFALLIEWYNQLHWTASISPNVTGYNIRRNGTLIATNVPGTSYRDNNRPKNGTDVYLITSVNAEGSESLTGLEITVSHL